MQNRPYLYGQLNNSVVEANYQFLPTDTATIYKELNNEVKVDVNTANIVRIKEYGSPDSNNLTYKLSSKNADNQLGDLISFQNVGRYVELELTNKDDENPYKLIVKLKSSENGQVINTSTVNLPIEYSFEVTKEGYIRLPNFDSADAVSSNGYKTFKCINGVLTMID